MRIQKTNTTIKTYSELITLPTFEERYRYLRLDGIVGVDTFGVDRIFNQMFYQRSKEWRRVRDEVFIRDNGCDLGIVGRDIYGKYIVHHINPITIEDLEDNSPFLLDPEFLITTSLNTHNAIHYGDEDLLPKDPVERKPYDTCPWRH